MTVTNTPVIPELAFEDDLANRVIVPPTLESPHTSDKKNRTGA